MINNGSKHPWRPNWGIVALCAFAAVCVFLVPDRWVHWIYGLGWGVIGFGALLLERNKPGFNAVLILVVGGALIFCVGASAFPLDALFSWKKMRDIDIVGSRFIWTGTAM